MEFTVGDIVYLKSNPKNLMTVSFITKISDISGFGSKTLRAKLNDLGYANDDFIIQWTWHNGSNYTEDIFKTKMLKIESGSSPNPLFEVGDVVYLKSNPVILMTVATVVKKTNLFDFTVKLKNRNQIWKLGFQDNTTIIKCTRFSEAEVIIDYFIPQVLAQKV